MWECEPRYEDAVEKRLKGFLGMASSGVGDIVNCVMKKSASAQKTVLETILEWSQDRPVWQRDALRRIVSKGRLGEDDLKELIDLCKQGRGAKNTGPKAIPLEKAHLPANPGQGEAVSLVSITDVEGVNDLAPGQTLTFEENAMVIVYGDNATGKSGYGRICKRACRARHPGKIEPNIYAEQHADARGRNHHVLHRGCLAIA